MNNYTKGEWTVSQIKGGGQRIQSGGDIIAWTSNNPEYPQLKESQSNANLIASAPVLLEALKDIVKAHEVKMGKSAINLRVELAKDAIQQAEGGSNE